MSNAKAAPACMPARLPARTASRTLARAILATAFAVLGGLLPGSAVAQGLWMIPGRPVEIRDPVPAVAPPASDRRDAAGRLTLGRSERPILPLLAPGTVVLTGFPGAVSRQPHPRLDGADKPVPAEMLLFIDPDGTSAGLFSVDDLGRGYDASQIRRAPYDRILARDVGLVFGAALDDEQAPNLYLAATSAFGLNIVGRDANGDRVPDRLVTGQADARWMPAQWGNDPAAGPGSIWRVDGRTGQIALFANITLDGVPNSGPALGDLAYDAAHRQLFVSDLDTGMIHRLDLAGNDLEHFDHGRDGRSAMGLTPVPFDPLNRLDITSTKFDAGAPDGWAFAAPQRRVWGLAVQGDRLYYAVAEGVDRRVPEVWSLGLDPRDGHFLTDARREFAFPEAQTDAQTWLEIPDMVFDGTGALILAQRGARRADLAHEHFAQPRRAAALRFVREQPDDPTTPFTWAPAPHVYSVGFPFDGANAAGGVDVGPGYDARGRWVRSACTASLWTTGQSLRDDRALRDALEPGGALNIDGAMVQPSTVLTPDNRPPWLSFSLDYDGQYPQRTRDGQMGDVEVLGCRDAGAPPRDQGGIPDQPGGGDQAGGDQGGDGCTKPGGCLPPPPPACMAAQTVPICDPATGTFSMATRLVDLTGRLDRARLNNPDGLLSSVPGDVDLAAGVLFDMSTLAPGQHAQLEVCGYDSAGRATGQPFDCCKITVTLTQPGATCERTAP